jgi:hypothetical protein
MAMAHPPVGRCSHLNGKESVGISKLAMFEDTGAKGKPVLFLSVHELSGEISRDPCQLGLTENGDIHKLAVLTLMINDRIDIAYPILRQTRIGLFQLFNTVVTLYQL